MNRKQIKDNYSFKEMAFDVYSWKVLKKAIKMISQLGYKKSTLENIARQIDTALIGGEELLTLPDEFNRLFSKRGRVAFESMNAQVMKEAIEIALENSIDRAEDLLVDFYGKEDNLRFYIGRLSGIDEFQPRIQLIKYALEDYFNGRYHACIPILLIMIDGVVNDFKQKGFFAADTDLEIWDSIAGHSTGLNSLKQIMTTQRKKTRTEEISIPYRHGILHGRDLGYGNRLVAAKTWAAIFALGDWARDIKAGKDDTRKEFKIPTIRASAKSMAEGIREYMKIKEDKILISQWEPRRKICISKRSQPYEYEKGTPEETLFDFLKYFQNKNYGKMALLTEHHALAKSSLNIFAGELRRTFSGVGLIAFRAISIEDKAPAISVVSTELHLEKDVGESCVTEHEFRLIYEDDEGRPLPRNCGRGVWRITYDYKYIGDFL